MTTMAPVSETTVLTELIVWQAGAGKITTTSPVGLDAYICVRVNGVYECMCARLLGCTCRRVQSNKTFTGTNFSQVRVCPAEIRDPAMPTPRPFVAQSPPSSPQSPPSFPPSLSSLLPSSLLPFA